MSDGLITFSDGDVKSGYLVQTPAWTRLKVLSYRKSRAASGESDNYFVEVKGLNGEMDSVEFTKMFNTSKGFKGQIIRFFTACNGGNELTAGKAYNFDDTVGIEVEGYVQRGQDKNGNPVNDISDFRPVQG